MRIVNEPDREGEVVTVGGKVIGRHRGYWNYTVGMRKGLGIGGGTPYYVVALDAAKNRVIVGFREDAVRYELELCDTVGTIDKTPRDHRVQGGCGCARVQSGRPRRFSDKRSGDRFPILVRFSPVGEGEECG